MPLVFCPVQVGPNPSRDKRAFREQCPCFLRLLSPKRRVPSWVCVCGCAHTQHARAPVIHPKSDGHGLLNRICTESRVGHSVNTC